MVSGRSAAACVAFALTVASPRLAAAQAWVPSRGEGSVSVLYQNLFVHDHFLAGGARVNRGQIQTNNLLFDLTYGLTDRMTVSFAAPFVRTRYAGLAPHPSIEDDGRT